MKKKTFRFEALKSADTALLSVGSEGTDVRNLQTFLSSAGYLRRERVPGKLCEWTADALRRFQKNYKLPVTGEADEKTLGLIQRPRCGVPDLPAQQAPDSPLAPFVLSQCKYNRTDLTFAFTNSTPDLPGNRAFEIVREAFGVWEEVSTLRFAEVAPEDSPTFTIAWERGNHGDGYAFDDAGINNNVLAHAFFPPPCGGPFAGALHFDEFERWTDAAAEGSVRLLNVAIHEIGHLLGLQHSDQQQSIMFAFYSDAIDQLFQDDIDGIRALYGQP